MDFVQAVSHCFHNYVSGAGRAARSEYWYFVLFSAVLSICAAVIDAALFPPIANGPLGVVVSLALFLPSVAVGIRRLHDIDRTGWWLLITLTGIGIILLIIWACLRGTPGDNRFGVDPLATPPGSA
jgi:uncharacterized membrane protein YhaH (DUF805 family)